MTRFFFDHGGWLCLSDPPEVMPLNDLGEHVDGERCKCKPFIEGVVLVHNSFDGREAIERGERKAS